MKFKPLLSLLLALAVVTTASAGTLLNPYRFASPLLPFPEGMTHYYDGTQVVVESGRVTTLIDQIGDADFTQATEAQRPYFTTSLEGYPAISFPPTVNASMSATGLGWNDRSFTVFIVRRGMMGIQQCWLSARNTTFDAYGYIANTAFQARMEGGNKISSNPAVVNLEIQGFRGATVAQGGTSVLWSASQFDDAGALGNYTFTEGMDLGRKYHATSPLRWAYGDVVAIGMWDRPISNTEWDDTVAAIESRFPALQQTWTKQLLIEGDSILAGSNSGTSTRNVAAFLAKDKPDWRITCMAVSGAKLDGTTNQSGIDVRQALTPFWYDNVNFTQNKLVLMGGRNDVILSDAATTYAALVAVVNEYIAQGWETYVCTLVDTTTPTAHSRIITLNDLIRADLADDCAGLAGVIDVAANPNFDPLLDAATNGAIYTDASHLTETGNEILAGIIKVGAGL